MCVFCHTFPPLLLATVNFSKTVWSTHPGCDTTSPCCCNECAMSASALVAAISSSWFLMPGVASRVAQARIWWAYLFPKNSNTKICAFQMVYYFEHPEKFGVLSLAPYLVIWSLISVRTLFQNDWTDEGIVKIAWDRGFVSRKCSKNLRFVENIPCESWWFCLEHRVGDGRRAGERGWAGGLRATGFAAEFNLWSGKHNTQYTSKS